jgi:hypothetical protein
MKRYTVAATVFGALVMTAASAAAQKPAMQASKGVVLSASAVLAPGITVKGEDIEGELTSKFGGGIGLQAGYEFSRAWMAFATMDIAKQGSSTEGLDGSFGFVNFELGGRYAFPTAGTVRPYVLATIGARALGAKVSAAGSEDTDISVSGSAFNIGGGFEYPLAPSLSLASELRLGFGKFGKYKEDGEEEDIKVDNSMSSRVRVGVTWRPGR